MRVQAGKFRGKKLLEYYNEATRPTTDRVKENIFNVLASMGVFDPDNPPAVLDLFAGTGQYGIEALSRGSREVTFNDKDPAAFKVINKNLASIISIANGVFDTYNLCYKKCLTKLRNKKFDIVFLDPPYSEENLAHGAISFLRSNEMLSDNSVIVFETQTPNLEFPDFTVKIKTYGRARVYFLK